VQFLQREESFDKDSLQRKFTSKKTIGTLHAMVNGIDRGALCAGAPKNQSLTVMCFVHLNRITTDIGNFRKIFLGKL
jgi:hypothetical protein